MRNMAANTISILIVAGIVLLVAIGIAKREYTAPGPLREEVIVVLRKGAGLKDTSRILAEHGVIENEFLFRLGARYRREDRAIRYGEYLIPAGISMEEVLALLVRGETIEHKLTVAEGLTSYRIVEMLRASLILTGEIAEVPPEGSLAPDTYFIQRNQSRSDLLARMTEAQAAALAQAWEMRAPDLPLTSPEEVLILASIVEKETGVADERGRVASVFLNRLKRGMPLQSDPTVVYGVTGGEGPLGRGLRRSELDRVTPYNTYLIAGLPPTPIAAPGREAIMAVVNPEETDFLYFVADGSGGHVFATTLRQHNRNVAAWRRIEKNSKP
ncbi:MAG: endolytic transglycosylase MltG [Proteobacteria bacterium]|nr:endolytic transglycosylase MltG [Pseudomonadota bacterium]MCH8951527.1 endolytic transglycosylase MltG [Pseudomonadota bacterium]